MATEILMPALSPTMTEGNLSRWLKKEGDAVSPGDIIAEIETDKATMEIECIDEGVLGKIVIPESTPDVPVNQLIAVLISEGEGKEEIQSVIEAYDSSFVQPKLNDKPTQQVKEPQSSSTSSNTGAATDGLAAKVQHVSSTSQNKPASGGDSRIKASPLAKRIANDMNIDLRSVAGSGPRGRIVKKDVENYAPSAGSASHSSISYGRGEDVVIPLTQVQKVVASRLSECKQTVPHFYLTSECRVDKLLAIRKEMNDELKEDGIKISVNDMIMKAAARALCDVPEANSAWNGDSIIRFGNVDISVAVATEGSGLITPIVFSADKMGLAEISQAVKGLVKKANAHQLAPHEFQGGSFSVSNLGMYDVDEFKAIINPPQACILAIGNASKKPVIGVNGEVEVGMVLKLSLSCDHRVVDGKIGAVLLKRIKLYLEKPYMLLK